MSFLIHNFRNAIRTFLNIDSRELSHGSFCQKFSIQTAVFGYDNKNTHYKTKINPKWSYGDDACFITKNNNSFVIGLKLLLVYMSHLYYRSCRWCWWLAVLWYQSKFILS